MNKHNKQRHDENQQATKQQNNDITKMLPGGRLQQARQPAGVVADHGAGQYEIIIYNVL